MGRKNMIKASRGAGMTEYGILAGLVAVVALVSVGGMGTEIAKVFGGAHETIGGKAPATLSPQGQLIPQGQVSPEEIAIFVKGIGSTGIQASATKVSSSIAPETGEGDLMVAFVMHRSTLTPPPGWTVEITEKAPANNQWLSVLTKAYEAADGDAVEFQQSSAQRFISHILTIGGSDPAIATIAGAAGGSDQRVAPAYASADAAGIALAGSAEAYAHQTNNETVSVNEDWALTTPASIPQNRLAVAWRSTALDNLGKYRPGAVFTDSTTDLDDWSAVTLQITPGGRGVQAESFGPYDGYVDPGTWLILTENDDTATMSGQPGVLAKSGADMVTGTASGEIFIGGPGDDTLHGLEGSDTYVYGPGDGSDTIKDLSYRSNETDKIEFRDIASTDVRLSQSSTREDHAFVHFADGEVMTIVEIMEPTAHKIELFEFSDRSYTEQQFRDRVMSDSKKPGALILGTGLSENYVHSAGDPSYTIEDLSYYAAGTYQDSLTFTDATSDDVKFINRGNNKNLDAIVGGSVVGLKWQDNNSHVGFIENVTFLGGGQRVELKGHQEVRDKADQDAKATGYVDGFQHSDRYRHSVKDDEDYTIYDESYYSQSSQPDSLEFVDAAKSDTTFIVKNGNYEITVDNGTGDVDTITILHQDNNSEKNFIEKFIFTDGELSEQGGRDKAADDAKPTGFVDGTQHSENYTHSVAKDEDYTILDESYYSQSSKPDKLTFLDATKDQTKFIVTGEDYVITVNNGTGDVDTITLQKQNTNTTQHLIESYAFADGPMSAQEVRDKAAADAKPNGVVYGTHFSENYVHSAAKDGSYEIFDLSYYSSSSQPDTLTFTDRNPGDLWVRKEDTDAVLHVDGGAQVVRIDQQFGPQTNRKVETFHFMDGTTWTAAQLEANIDPLDVYTYASADADLVIDDNSLPNELHFTDLNKDQVTFHYYPGPGPGGDMAIATHGSTFSNDIVIKGQLRAAHDWGVEFIQFANGERLDRGGIMGKYNTDPQPANQGQ